MSPAEISENDFPDQGILWRGWDDETLRIIADKQRPVLLFVADPDPLVWPFLREIFKAMPANARLRELLHDFFTPLFIEARALPEDLRAFGAGSRYHVAVLSPHGFTPMVTVNVLRAPDEVIATIVDTLERLADVWRSVD
ncbi:MAG TPA: hypothetical protein VEM36_09080 [Xanthobacteraceae bacterium]|nr:hypothetical protein [Xanthobacteraceae bacterium]